MQSNLRNFLEQIWFRNYLVLQLYVFKSAVTELGFKFLLTKDPKSLFSNGFSSFVSVEQRALIYKIPKAGLRYTSTSSSSVYGLPMNILPKKLICKRLVKHAINILF